MPKILSQFKDALKVSNVIWYLTLSDVFTWGVYTILSSLAGIYLAMKLGENVVAYVGVGIAIYSLSRASAQIPFGMLEDKLKQERDEIFILLISCVLMGLPYLVYPLIDRPEIYYFLQLIFGLGCGMNLVSWRKLFAKNVALDREGMDYGFYETVMSICIAIFSAIAGVIANLSAFYFDLVIVTIGIIMIIGSMWPAMIYRAKYLRTK